MKKLFFSLSLVLLAVLLSPLLINSPGTAASAMPGPYSYRFYCASDDFYRHFCSIETPGRVQIVRQRSESPCVYGRTWGTAGSGVWVDRGCRADFVVNASEWSNGDDYGHYRDYGNYRRSRVLYCASDDFDFRGCPADTYSGVRIVRQRSDSPCIYGRTWGYDERGIWVDRGCRADFEVGRLRYGRDWER